MTDFQLYTFSAPLRGSLDLEVDVPAKQFFNQPVSESCTYRIKGLDPAESYNNILFFEWQSIRYTYLSDKNSSLKSPFSFIINNRVQKNKSVLKNNDSHLLSGQFSFKDQVGETIIQIVDAENTLVFQLETEVFPQKMDYKSDYKAMMAEISLIVQNLAYDSLKDTFRKSRARLNGTPTINEWWNILDVLGNQLLLSLTIIKRQPKHEIRSEDRILPVELIKQSGKKNAAWFSKNVRYSNQDGLGFRVTPNRAFARAMSAKKYVTYDTYENRFVAWAVKKTIDRLRNYKKCIDDYSVNLDYAPLFTRINGLQSRLQSLVNGSPFNEVGKFEERSHFSTSLTQGSGYRDFMHIYLLLLRGLEILNNDIFKIEQKDISTLYEYWCFLKLVQLLKEQNSLNVDYQNLIKIESGKFVVKLKKGNQSKIKFEKAGTSETTTIYFNREYKRDLKRIFTFDQVPDFSIEFKRNGFSKPFWFLFDAKYRFEEKVDNGDFSFNVPQDAIGQLHRYRDAILHTEPINSTYRTAIKNLGGVILYPYPLSEDEFEANNYYKSIDEVNIGALPFLPSKTGLAKTLLNKMVNKLPEEHFEQFIEMDHTEYDQKRNLWKEWVTIGVIPKSEIEKRRQFVSQAKIYHVPFIKNLNSKIYLSKSILTYDAVNYETIHYDVKDWELLSRPEMVARGANWYLNHDKYLVFNLRNAKRLSDVGKIGTINGFRYTTDAGLKKYLETGNKNYFYITNPDAARLFEELLFLKKDCKIKWRDTGNDPSMIEFKIDNLKILSSDTFQILHFELDNKPVSLVDLIDLISTLK